MLHTIHHKRTAFQTLDLGELFLLRPLPGDPDNAPGTRGAAGPGTTALGSPPACGAGPGAGGPGSLLGGFADAAGAASPGAAAFGTLYSGAGSPGDAAFCSLPGDGADPAGTGTAASGSLPGRAGGLASLRRLCLSGASCSLRALPEAIRGMTAKKSTSPSAVPWKPYPGALWGWDSSRRLAVGAVALSSASRRVSEGCCGSSP